MAMMFGLGLASIEFARRFEGYLWGVAVGGVGLTTRLPIGMAFFAESTVLLLPLE